MRTVAHPVAGRRANEPGAPGVASSLRTGTCRSRCLWGGRMGTARAMTAHGNCASMSGVVPAGRSLPGQYRPAIIMCDRDNAMLRQPVLLLQFAVSSLRCAVTTRQPYVARSGAGNERSCDRRLARLVAARGLFPMAVPLTRPAALSAARPVRPSGRPAWSGSARVCACSCWIRLPPFVLHEPGGKLTGIRGLAQHAANVGEVCPDDFRGCGLERGGRWCSRLSGDHGGLCRGGRAGRLTQPATRPKTEFSGQYPLDQPEEIGDGIAYHAALTAGLQFIEDILTLLLRQLTQRRLNILLLPGLDADQAGWQLHGTGFFVFARAVRTFFILIQTIRRRRILNGLPGAMVLWQNGHWIGGCVGWFFRGVGIRRLRLPGRRRCRWRRIVMIVVSDRAGLFIRHRGLDVAGYP